MKIIQYFFLTIALLIQSILSLQAQNTEGKDFWITFSAFGWYPPATPQGDMQIRIVNGDVLTTGRIYFTELAKNVDFQIQPNMIFDHQLSEDEKLAVYNRVLSKTNKSIRITTSNPVSVYAFLQSGQFAEATIVYPVTALGTEYYAISYHHNSSYDEAYAIVATQNNTHIYHDNILVETLNTGQVYYRLSGVDMTGSHVTTNNPVAFFALQRAIAIPNGGYISNLMEQLTPVKTWGKKFFVPLTVFEKGTVRIVVSQDNTNISLTGGTIRNIWGGQPHLTNLQAGQYVELEILLSDNGCFIEADKPVGVCTYMESGFSNSPEVPSQALIPGIEQTVSKAMIAPFIPIGTTRLTLHYALIITPTVTKNNTTVSIGGATPTNLSGVVWYDHSKGMSFCSFLLTDETKSYIFANHAGMIVFGYGTGTIQASSSYYYNAYSAMRDLDAAFYANDIHFQDLKENPFCAGLVEFRAEINGLHPTHPERIKWFVNGTEEPGTLNQETWNRTFTPGEYEIKMVVRYENDEIATKIGTLKIIPCNYSAEFFANDIPSALLPNYPICNKTGKVDFRAVIEGLSQGSGSLLWYINGVKEDAADDQLTWSKTFETGTYQIKMWVRYDNGTDETITATLKVEIFWLKMQNIRH